MSNALKKLYILPLLFFSSLLSAQNYDDYDEDESLPYVEIRAVDNFASLSEQARRENKVIMLEMSASYCGYCKTLEEEIIKPMLRSGDYTGTVLIRKLDIDSHYPMRDLDGADSSPAKLSHRMGVYVTPTLIFLDGRGREVAERIIGINSLDFFGGYVDQALQKGLDIIRSNP